MFAGYQTTVKNISYIVLVFGVMAVVLVLGFGSDQLGPFGAMIMMVAALALFVVIGLRSGIGRPETTKGAGGASASWASGQGLASENWLDLVIDHNEMTRHIGLEIDRSRRFDRTFTVIVIAPDLVAMVANGAKSSTDSELNTMRLFAL